jgi:hypothetical protein
LAGAGLLSCWHLARHLHPRLGAARVTVQAAPACDIPLSLTRETG